MSNTVRRKKTPSKIVEEAIKGSVKDETKMPEIGLPIGNVDLDKFSIMELEVLAFRQSERVEATRATLENENNVLLRIREILNAKRLKSTKE